MQPVGLANTRISTDYAQKSPPSLDTIGQKSERFQVQPVTCGDLSVVSLRI